MPPPMTSKVSTNPICVAVGYYASLRHGLLGYHDHLLDRHGTLRHPLPWRPAEPVGTPAASAAWTSDQPCRLSAAGVTQARGAAAFT